MKKVTLDSLQHFKQQGEKFAVLTAYDSSFAQLVEQAGVEVILVGDSLGMVMQGHDSTVPVTTEDMVYHVKCVTRTVKHSLVIADMSFMSYASPQQTFANAAALLQAGANMVKVEGGAWLVDTVQQLTERGIAVCGHLGLTPQSVDSLSGYRVQGREQTAADQLLSDAIALQNAGARLLVLECVPASLAARVSESLDIPVIGIGAGVNCDAQVLVLQDMLGMNTRFTPKFVKNFMPDGDGTIQGALKAYVAAVKQGLFPGEEHSFGD